EILAKLKDIFYGGCCDEEGTAETIKNTFEKYGYLIDTHTSVAVNVYDKYVEETGDDRPVVIASTASPYKFANSVLEALGLEVPADEFEAVELLSNETNTAVPAPISALKSATVRFSNVCNKEDMNKVVLDRLGIKG
ncbi:MAG: threonine synthase, partial [Clostridia bacterium]|nr:threonine synthase [Clostridia bacterium]